MYITFVKKQLADGSLCRKCQDVEQRLRRDGWDRYIDRVVVAVEGDADSEGMQLARHYNVDRAPFFIVGHDDGSVQVETIYLRMIREVLEPAFAHESESVAA